MVEKLRIFESNTFDPYVNLATEKYLLDAVAPNECILYLWQNQNTVVIGRNQNPWVECRTSLLEEEDGHLARRLSGGGAVFHDLGNLNFTFLVSPDNYDVDRQLSVIQTACGYVGICAEKSGRNDLLAGGCKFSGNAFYKTKLGAYHHGTLLINADMDKLQRYLSPSKAKLQAKGVASVRSRVINLTELASSLTCQEMKLHMAKAFAQVYGLTPSQVTIGPDEWAEIEETSRLYGSWDYLYGTPLPFSFSCEARYEWGQIRLELQAINGSIIGVKAYSDAMDWQISTAIEQALTGCAFRLGDMQAALRKHLSEETAEDLCGLLQEHI